MPQKATGMDRATHLTLAGTGSKLHAVTGKGFRDLSPAGKVWATVAIFVSLVLVAAAQRDIHTRSESELRGNKRVWQLVCLNAIGALAYFRLGRRET